MTLVFEFGVARLAIVPFAALENEVLCLFDDSWN